MPTKSNNKGGQGGKRAGAGRKKKATIEKAENGNPGGRKLEVMDIPELEGVDILFYRGIWIMCMCVPIPLEI